MKASAYEATNFAPATIKLIVAARDIIITDIRRHIAIKQLAKSAGTNTCTLKKGFKALFKITIYQYLLESRMRHAGYLLGSTRMKEKEIAAHCGFESLPGFITAFRQFFGMSPTAFKQQFQTDSIAHSGRF